MELGGRRRFIQHFHGRDEAVSVPRDGFDEAGRLPVVRQRFAKFCDRFVETAFKVDEHAVRPKLFLELFPRDGFTLVLNQVLEYLERLSVELDLEALLSKLAGYEIHLEQAEAHEAPGSGRHHHFIARESPQHYIKRVPRPDQGLRTRGFRPGTLFEMNWIDGDIRFTSGCIDRSDVTCNNLQGSEKENEVMKRNLPTMLVMLFIATFAMSTVPAAQAQDQGGCSNAPTAGRWGFTTAGTVFPASGPVPVVVVKLEVTGNLEGTQTRSLNGQPVDHETISGTILMHPDCTATATITVFHSGVLNRTATLDLVFVDNQRAIRGVFTSAIAASGAIIGTVLTFDGNKQDDLRN